VKIEIDGRATAHGREQNAPAIIMTMLLGMRSLHPGERIRKSFDEREKALLEEWSGRVVRRYEFD
jgi:hypothetical protein